MEFNYTYTFTDKAEQDLDEIMRYITVDLNNLTAAKNLFTKIFESIDNLKHFPDSGLSVENEFLADKSIKRILVDNYIMYYKVIKEESVICIIRIVYGKRNLDDILRLI